MGKIIEGDQERRERSEGVDGRGGEEEKEDEWVAPDVHFHPSSSSYLLSLSPLPFPLRSESERGGGSEWSPNRIKERRLFHF